MVPGYGYSDDLVERKGSTYRAEERDGDDRDVRICLADETGMPVTDGKQDLTVGSIRVEQKGRAAQTLSVYEDKDPERNRDGFEMDAEIRRHSAVPRKGEHSR